MFILNIKFLSRQYPLAFMAKELIQTAWFGFLFCTTKNEAKKCALLGFRHFYPKEKGFVILKNDFRKIQYLKVD